MSFEISQLYPVFLYHQVVSQPPGNIPESALGTIDWENLTRCPPEWIKSLTSVELNAFQSRFKDLGHIMNSEKPCTLSQQEQEMLQKIYPFCTGFEHPGMNLLEVLFSYLFLNPNLFKDKTRACTIDGHMIHLSAIAKEVNGKLLPVALWNIQTYVKGDQQNPLDMKSLGLEKIQNFYQNLSHEAIKDRTRFSKKTEALSILMDCCLSEGLFPLLLRPVDEFEVVHAGNLDRLASRRLTEEKCTLLEETTELALLSIERMQAKTESTYQKKKTYPKFASPKNAFIERLDKLKGLIKKTAIRSKKKALLELEEKARQGDLSSAVSLGQEIRAIRNTISETKSILNQSLKELLPFLEEHDLGAQYNACIQYPLHLTHKVFEALLADVENQIQITKKVQDLDLFATKSAFLTPLDLLVNTGLGMALSESSKQNAQKVLALSTSLQALGIELLSLRSPLYQSTFPSHRLSTLQNVSYLIQEAQKEFTSLQIENPAFALLAELQKKANSWDFHYGTPYIFSHLVSPLGSEFNLSGKDMKLLSALCGVSYRFVSDTGKYAQLNRNKIIGDDTRLEKYTREIEGFVTKVCVILKQAPQTDAQAKKLSLAIYQLVQDEFPELPTHYLEELLGGVPESIDTIYTAMEFLRWVHLHPFIEIGRYASLVEEPKPAKTSKHTSKPTSPKELPTLEETIPEEKNVEAPQPPAQRVSVKDAVSLTRTMAAKLLIQHKNKQGDATCRAHAEQSLAHLAIHLQHIEDLLGCSKLHPLSFTETLQRESALALEASLNYMIAYYQTKNKQGKFIILPENHASYRHKLHTLANLFPHCRLTSDEKDFLESFSSMLSDAARPHQNKEAPYVGALLSDPQPKRAIRETTQTLELIHKLLGKKALPNNETRIKASSTKELPVTKALSTCWKKGEEIKKAYHTATLDPIPGLENSMHNYLRRLHLKHLSQDLPYHLKIVNELLNASTPPALLNGLVHHLGHLVEKGIKLSLFYLPQESEETPGQHILFDEVEHRLRLHDHNLSRLLPLLPELQQTLTQVEQEALTALASFSEFTRYPAGRPGILPSSLQEMTLLFSVREGFVDPKNQTLLIQLLGPEQEEWGAKSQARLQEIHTNTFKPFIKSTLSALEKIFDHALEVKST
ncbi:MAG: hypothetical protein K940chlam9_00836 [Chlamydiae bacterium]|nr:hypothetical protein [Chlamydiota bacterium]